MSLTTRSQLLLLLFASLVIAVPVISIPQLLGRQLSSSNVGEEKTPATPEGFLRAQWNNPKETLSVLLIIGGDIVQKAIAQMTGVMYLQVRKRTSTHERGDAAAAGTNHSTAPTNDTVLEDSPTVDNGETEDPSSSNGIAVTDQFITETSDLGGKEEGPDSGPALGPNTEARTLPRGHSASEKTALKPQKGVNKAMRSTAQPDTEESPVPLLKFVCLPRSSPPQESEPEHYWKLGLTPVAFSFGWVGFAFTSLISVLGEGLLMPQTDTPATVINLVSGTMKTNESWVLGRLVRDLGMSPILRKDAATSQSRSEHGSSTVYMYKTKKGAGYPRIGRLWLAAVIIVVQFVISSIPIWDPRRTRDERNWIILMITAAGTVLAILASSIPQWQLEKFRAARNTKGSFILTKGNGHLYSYVLLNPNDSKQSMNLEHLAVVRPEDLRSVYTKVVVPLLALCWVFLLLCVGGLENDTWYLFAVGLLGMIQNIVLAIVGRSPDTHGLPIEPATDGDDCIIRDRKVMRMLKKAEMVRPYVGIRLKRVYFEDTYLNPDEKQYWARQERTASVREARRVKLGLELLTLQTETEGDEKLQYDEEKDYIHRAKIVFLLGAPGSGKGLRCKIIRDEKDYHHLSVGDLLRSLCVVESLPDEARAGLSRKELQAYLDSDELLPAAKIVQILRYQIIAASFNGKKRFIIDGFPRSEEMAAVFAQDVSKHICDRFIDQADEVRSRLRHPHE
ncbi:hypothetical protein CKM354_000819000 [Cercospora kikuchii]|uniref:Adenylate kinase n=1 Tax=Cercospora kikuchii TaxID=84275 RepID=A0A9P3CME2_9PEZI|nr:uncharacterized protein CKM354_000819000 [Cercospora kikuchii]GIZ45006.1 hypothetical protein CKM354_000819000 [Cercospora kikuchii]